MELLVFAVFSLNKDNYSVSSSSSTFSTAVGSGTYAAVTNLSASITVSGNKPVLIMLTQDGSSNAGNITMNQPSDVTSIIPQALYLRVKRGSSVISTLGTSEGASAVLYPETAVLVTPSIVQVWDRPSAGTYTYSVEIGLKESVTTSTAEANYLKLVLMEVLY